jgi:tetratricopeptide (TPR) repeat protein
VSAPHRWTAFPLRRLGPLAVLALGLAGCGDDGLWARWSAERGTWRARRAVERIALNPETAPPRDWERAAEACRAVTGSFPAAEWSARERAGSPYAAGVLDAAGRAAMLLARLDDLRGRPEEAAAGYESARTAFRDAPAVSLAAAVERARLLEREGRAAAAEAAWTVVAREYEAAAPGSGELREAVLDAPLFVARARRQRGDERGVDSVLRAAEGLYEGQLAGQRGRPAVVGLCLRLGESRRARGDVAGSLAALRTALNDPGAGAQAPRLVLVLAEQALAGMGPDTALAYARWAAEGFGPGIRPAGLLLVARAWRSGGESDSALRAYERLVEENPEDADAVARARYERARLLEDLGRWDQARGEYHALASAVPVHPLALEAQVRVVRHYLARGEREVGLAEAGHALRTMEESLAGHQDDTVQVRVGEARALLLLETGDSRRACGALAALLQRYPEAPFEAALLARAAEAAETVEKDEVLALELYRAAEWRAGDAELRDRVARALARLDDESR